MTKKVSQLLVEAGVIPQNVVVQLEQNRFLPEGLNHVHGRRQVSLDKDPKEVEGFIRNLQSELEKESSEIRETEIEDVGDELLLWVQCSTSPMLQMRCRVDRFGRVCIPQSALGTRKPKAVSLTEDGPRYQIVGIEPRYSGDKVVSTVCYLEE